MDFNQLANNEVVNQVIENLKNRGITAMLVETKEQALEKIKELIHNKKQYEFLSKNAFKYALENHDISVTVRNLLDMLS